MTHFPHSRDINNRSAMLAADLYLYEKRTVSVLFSIAESEGFEPPIRRNAYTAFRVRLFRPLRQLSSKAGAKVLQKFDMTK